MVERIGADSKCFNHLDNETVILSNNSSKNVKAVISVESSDSIRTMVANYNISTNKLLRTRTGKIFTNSFNNIDRYFDKKQYSDCRLCKSN